MIISFFVSKISLLQVFVMKPKTLQSQLDLAIHVEEKYTHLHFAPTDR